MPRKPKLLPSAEVLDLARKRSESTRLIIEWESWLEKYEDFEQVESIRLAIARERAKIVEIDAELAETGWRAE